MRIAVVTGNPKPASRTHGVALAVADTLRAALVPSARSAPKVPSPAAPGAPAPLVVDLAEHASRPVRLLRRRTHPAHRRGRRRRRRHLRVAHLQGRLHRHAQGVPRPLRRRRPGRDRRGPRDDRRLARPPAGRRGSPAPRPGRAGRHRPRPRPLRHRTRHLRPRRRRRQVGRNRRPPDPPRPRNALRHMPSQLTGQLPGYTTRCRTDPSGVAGNPGSRSRYSPREQYAAGDAGATGVRMAVASVTPPPPGDSDAVGSRTRALAGGA